MRRKHRKSFHETEDKYIATIPWNRNSVVVVFQRQHGDQVYTRFRVYRCQQLTREWYPDKYFVVEPGKTEALAEALLASVRNEPVGEPPEWWRASLIRQPAPEVAETALR